MMWPPPRAFALLLAMLTGCTAEIAEPRLEDCAKLPRELIRAVQEYVDGFAEIPPEELAEAEAPPTRAALHAAVSRYRERAEEIGCDPRELNDMLIREIDSLRGEGEIGESVAGALREVLLQAASGAVPSVPEPRRIGPDDDLPAALAGTVAGSALILEPGIYRVDAPLTLVEGISLVGSGRDATTILSRAPGTALLFLGTGRVRIEDLSIVHRGPEPASVVRIPRGGYLIREARLAGGRRDEKAGTGGSGLVVGGDEEQEDAPATEERREMRIERSEFARNMGAGILVAGGSSPTIVDTTVKDNPDCGICFVGDAGGIVRDSRIRSNRVGIGALGRSRPRISGSVLTGNRIGIQIADRARPIIASNLLHMSEGAAMLFSDRSRGRARKNRCTGSNPVIVLFDTARPSLDANACTILRG